VPLVLYKRKNNTHLLAFHVLLSLQSLLTLDQNCDVNVRGNGDLTPLHLAVNNNDTEMVKVLVSLAPCVLLVSMFFHTFFFSDDSIVSVVLMTVHKTTCPA